MVNARYLTEKGAADYRDKYARSLLRRLSARAEAAVLRRALAAAGASGSILDLPCGAGRFAELIGRFADFYCAADFSMPMIRLCRGILPAAASLLQTDAHAVALGDRSFDGVVVMRLIHHLPDPSKRRAVVAEAARVARRFLIVSFLDKGTVKQRLHAVKSRLYGRPVRRAAIGREEIRRDLEEAGFLLCGFFGLSSLFSGQTVAAFVRRVES